MKPIAYYPITYGFSYVVFSVSYGINDMVKSGIEWRDEEKIKYEGVRNRPVHYSSKGAYIKINGMRFYLHDFWTPELYQYKIGF